MTQWKIIEGDCIEIMRGMENDSVDIVVTDPPYGVGLKYKSFDDTQEAVAAMAKDWLPEAIRVSRGPVAFTPGAGAQHLYPPPTWQLGWAMKSGSGLCSWGFQCYHPIMVYGKCPYLSSGLGARPDTLFLDSCKASAPKSVHPCAKPLEVMSWILDRVDPTSKATVLDPFCGSGTTGMAAVATGRGFIGIEKEPDYAKRARVRIENSTPLFGNTP